MFIVTEAAKRPASTKDACFYCQQAIGETHKDDCVLVSKKVRVRMTVEYEIEVPVSWDQDMIEFHRNDGSWCSDNAIDELKELSERDGCLCHTMRFDFVKDTSGPYLKEG